MKITKHTRKSVVGDLQDSIYHKHGDYIEITEWTNGEGYDIHVSNHREQVISLHETEFEIIKKLIKKL